MIERMRQMSQKWKIDGIGRMVKIVLAGSGGHPASHLGKSGSRFRVGNSGKNGSRSEASGLAEYAAALAPFSNFNISIPLAHCQKNHLLPWLPLPIFS